MTADEPTIFQEFSPYMKARLMIASAILFRHSRWENWTYGHEKLLGIALFHFETKKERRFKYSKLLKKYAYGRTQNYKLLKAICETKILVREGNGYYSFSPDYQGVIQEIMEALKMIDKIGAPRKEDRFP